MKVNMLVDFSGIEDLIGTGEGVADGANDQQYISGLINAAHNVASLEFDVDAAATAAAGALTHMFEFGTTGITRGAQRFGDPTSPEARLWTHHISDQGRSQNISYMFRPAVAPNPRPSATFYGVPNAVIRKLSRRKYVFAQKAAVNELGTTVHIKPKDKPFNFVPFYGKPARNPDYANRTYIFRPIEGNLPMESTPGDDAGMTGTFTMFWNTWWAGRGRELLSGTASETFNKDVAFLMKRYPPSQGGLEPVVRYNSRGRIYNRRRKVKARMIKLGAERGVNRRR